MERQNITISMPKDLLKKVKRLAVRKGTSVSGLLCQYLEDVVRSDSAYRRAAKRIEGRLRKGLNLGTHGKISWTRESLHER